jgi:uncharacterized membrane protein YfcA
MSDIYLLILLFFVIATVYSSAGFGGGSSYLAVLSLFPMAFEDMRMTALICNIVVVGTSVFLFNKHQYLDWKKTLPLITLSIPLAFLGGRLLIAERLFFILLAISLMLAAAAMLLNRKSSVLKIPQYGNAAIGGSIGFLSGVVGIGGGIFLSPLLHLSRWGKPKAIAATSAIFILVNSVAGLLGQWMTYGINLNTNKVLVLILAVFLGGQIGVRWTIHQLDPITIRRITAIVVLIVSLRLLFKYL